MDYTCTVLFRTSQQPDWAALGLPIARTTALSDRCYTHDVTFADDAAVAAFRAQIPELSAAYGGDICLQARNDTYRNKKLVVFDMDSTLIQQEVIDMIAAYADVEDKVSAITELAMNGKIDFNESLRRRASLLAGIPATVFESLKPDIRFTPGAHELCRALKKLGCTLAVVSGGFVPLARWVKAELGLDYAYANTLEISPDGTVLTGQVVGDIVNADRKAQLLRQIAAENGLSPEHAVAIGDGANDLVMMAAAGFGVAFNAKPIVQQKAPARLNTPTLLDVLYILGYSADEQRALLA
ncbi:HAD-like domain-containing protein [Dipodascopsis tothii]|uniref:HAD-like domain-containing protein n=1 Tax=Dipodascopsis tothii TaxID=44089 RepID=UPI0034CFDCE1